MRAKGPGNPVLAERGSDFCRTAHGERVLCLRARNGLGTEGRPLKRTHTVPLPFNARVVQQEQAPFARVANVFRAALLLGAGGGFLLACILTVSSMLNLSLGSWWLALAQAHGNLQLFGWAGLFVIGVSLHFLPRLRGAALRSEE